MRQEQCKVVECIGYETALFGNGQERLHFLFTSKRLNRINSSWRKQQDWVNWHYGQESTKAETPKFRCLTTNAYVWPSVWIPRIENSCEGWHSVAETEVLISIWDNTGEGTRLTSATASTWGLHSTGEHFTKLPGILCRKYVTVCDWHILSREGTAAVSQCQWGKLQAWHGALAQLQWQLTAL